MALADSLAELDRFAQLALVRFGRFADLLNLKTKPAHPVHEGLWAFGRGLAALQGRVFRIGHMGDLTIAAFAYLKLPLVIAGIAFICCCRFPRAGR